jgi:hypothetical protein
LSESVVLERVFFERVSLERVVTVGNAELLSDERLVSLSFEVSGKNCDC